MKLEDGEFHWRDGMTFRRMENGDVRIRQYNLKRPGVLKSSAFIPPHEWASIIAETADPLTLALTR